ncbi:uncharacterized protein LOC133711884 [Rosa rugosa]|uniref:uncharacterized protein LOC133711884 n=1 Tax=Rosa rugosa TaxID=74645 RepID=UPI002B40218F|nr:uncharacterized protein LOC133711884 [Rosa rugosa]
MALDKWQKNAFRARQQSMLGIRTRLEELIDAEACVVIQDEKKDLMSRLQTLLSQEEAFWRQRSKVTWLKEGDRNTGYFHRKTANRKRKNLIHGLYDEDDYEAMETTISAIHPCVTPVMNAQLCSPYSGEEIKRALFEMYPTKSPGPDGMPPLFFQHYWETIGEEVTAAVQSFLHTGQILKKINFTHICLIPKVSTPEHMFDLRPIALCNVIYKLCSKTIANRLKSILPALILPFQSAFIPGRLITDNILVANEMAHFVHNKREGAEGFMALKLDLSKAYDRMEWEFLRRVMNRFGFAQSWIDMIQDVIETYGRASGQLVNFNKSSVVFSKNVSDDMQEEISSLMGVEIVESHEKYLGLPTYVGRKKTATFQYIKDILAEKLKNWQGKLLSGACKDILIRMCARFWWGSTLDKRKIHWKSWAALCNTKEEGGLGFRSLAEFNSAMLAKQAWRIINNPSSLIARLYAAKYFPSGTFWTAELHASPSYSWRSILSTRDLIAQGFYWQIGNGEKVRVWCDPWIPGVPEFKPKLLSSNENLNLKVSELLLNSVRWNEDLVRNLFPFAEAEAILRIPLSSRVVEDRCVWRLERNGSFYVKTVYRLSFVHSSSRIPCTIEATSEFWNRIWKSSIPNAAKLHIWWVCQDILPSMARLSSKHVVLDSQICVLCDGEIETTLHLCRNFPFARQVLHTHREVRQTCFDVQTDGMEMVGWINFCAKQLAMPTFEVFLYLLWNIWKERNKRVWE